MPISPDGYTSPMVPHQLNVPLPDGSGFSVTVMIQSDGSPGSPVVDQAMDDALMSLLDYLQEWPGRRLDDNVTGQKHVFTVYQASPTNPIDLPPPPEDPPLAP